MPQIDFDTEGRPDIPVYNPNGGDVPRFPSSQHQPQYNPFVSPASRTARQQAKGWEQLYDTLPSQSRRDDAVQQPSFFDEPAADAASQPLNSPVEDKSPVHYQYKGCYIMTAVKSGLMVIDQHRADIRIRYEQYLTQLQTHSAQIQQVLFPEVVQFAPSELVMMEQLLPRLSAIGFDLTDLGQGSYAVNGIPAGIEGIDYVHLLRSMVDEAVDNHPANADELNSLLALSMARHAAIPRGQVLSNDEMENLVNGLFACSNVNYTPDGHAILGILPQQDIERLLG